MGGPCACRTLRGAGALPVGSTSRGPCANMQTKSSQNPYTNRYKHVGNASTIVSSLKNCKLLVQPPCARLIIVLLSPTRSCSPAPLPLNTLLGPNLKHTTGILHQLRCSFMLQPPPLFHTHPKQGQATTLFPSVPLSLYGCLLHLPLVRSPSRNKTGPALELCRLTRLRTQRSECLSTTMISRI